MLEVSIIISMVLAEYYKFILRVLAG